MPRFQTQGFRTTWGVWWAIAFVWWTLDGFTAATNYHRMGQGTAGEVTWEHAFRTAMSSAWLWVPLTVLALWLADRLPLDRESWRRHLPAHAAAAAAVCVLRALAVVVLNPWVGWYVALPPFREILMTSVANNLFLFWMLVGVGHALVYARRARERDEQLAQAQLHALRMQLNPHFLFNTLSAASALTTRDPKRARRVIVDLGELLRLSLDTTEEEVPLRDELVFLDRYLRIEEARMGDRLRVRIQADDGVLDALVPPLLLQPLVENAVKHGVAALEEGGAVAVEAVRQDGDLVLRVRDTGPGLPEGVAAAGGIGLGNVRRRLEGLYGAAASLSLESPTGDGLTATVRLPFRTPWAPAAAPTAA